MATISTNDIKIRYDIDLSKLQEATSQFDKITAEERKLLNELGKLKKQFDDVGDKAKKSGKDASNALGGIGQIASKIGPALVGIFAADRIINFARAVIHTTIEFESLRKAINFTSGSIEAGAANMQFLRDVSTRLGISLESAASGFKAISASATQAGYSNIQTQKIFENVSKAVAAFGLNSEDASGVFRALSQIISKGTVQAEELRGQIGDRIPGAFSIAAKAMGVTERELNKLMATGKVTAAEFVIPFTDALGKMSEQASTLDSMGKGLQRFSNAWQRMMETLGRQIDENVGIGKFVNALTRTLDYLATSTQTAMQAQEKAMAEGYQSMIDSEIATYEKGQKEKIRIAIETSLSMVSAELNAAREKQKLQKDEIDNLKGFHPFRRQAMRDNLKGLNEEVTQLENKQKFYQGEIKALDELINKSDKLNQVQADPKALKQEYDSRLKLLELLKQQRILIGELYGDPLGQLGAEKAFQEAKLNLQKEYVAKGLEITNIEIENTNLSRLNAEQEFNQKAKGLRMENYKEVVKTEEEIRKERAKTMQQGVKDAIEANDKIMANNALMLKIMLQEEELKRQIMSKTVELGQTISDGAFSIYQARLNNEMTLLQRRYDLEIQLAGGNQQKIDELNQQKAEKEKEIRTKQFKAEQAASVARILFSLGEQLIKYAPNPATAPLAVLAGAIAAAQIGIIAATPVPEFAEGTKGKPFKGGKAIVGERGVEKVVTESGKVYFTPASATLVDLPKGSQVIPNHALSRQELFLANHYANRNSSSASPVVGEIKELGSILKSLPITQLSMDEKGFEKFIRTPRRTTKILNNRFRSDS
jgi:tape measure domain-containing protein